LYCETDPDSSPIIVTYIWLFCAAAGGFLLIAAIYWFAFRGKDWWRCCCAKGEQGENYNDMFDGLAGYN
jgi:hypothetical protein